MTHKSHEADVEFIEALAKVLDSHDLTEIEVSREYADDDSLNVRIARISAPQAAIAPLPAATPIGVAPAAAPPAAAPEDPAQHPGAVTSPMVGTVYLQAEPGTPPFVRVGDSVSEGQTLLIIEAMKTMNHIPAPHAGTLKRILIEDGSPVEFGAPLMIVE